MMNGPRSSIPILARYFIIHHSSFPADFFLAFVPKAISRRQRSAIARKRSPAGVSFLPRSRSLGTTAPTRS
jgi:hypothetical protein